MTPAAETPPQGAGPAAWDGLVAALAATLSERSVPPRRTVVLVPYAQLMTLGRDAWRRGPGRAGGFVPRFESTRNWAHALAPFEPGADDLSLDAARDRVCAERLLLQAAGQRLPADLRPVLVARLCEAAAQLAPLAAAVDPAARAAWAAGLRPLLAPAGGALAWESLVLAVALEWAASSEYATDVLWREALEVDLLVVVPGLQRDPLAEALARRWGERALHLPLESLSAQPSAVPALHACADAEDEAERAAACVLQRLAEGSSPVALVAQDRLLSRRICALLDSAGVPVRDETGWKLSTSRAAARVLALLRAARGDASTDDVLDALKQCPRWLPAQTDALERGWRRQELASFAAVLGAPERVAQLPKGLADVLASLHAPRPLPQWLQALAQALRDTGLWDALAVDAAGQSVLRALWLDGPGAWLQAATRRLSPGAFAAWVREVLENASFTPPAQPGAPVVLLPMAQLLGRHFGAVVAPGCDDTHLSAAPEPPGDWSAAQREALGLPGREALADAALQAWKLLLAQPRLDILWRQSERDESLLPSPWVQALRVSHPEPAPDPRPRRSLVVSPVPPPQPRAAGLVPASLSASAYQDLRDCPYRFFALRQLGLGEAAELEAEPDRRDLGNWLHAVLRAFHEDRPAPRAADADRAGLDHHAEAQLRHMGLSGPAFLPFRAAWPALREGYLAWLHAHEARDGRAGPRFEAAEVERTAALGRWRLLGKLDRVDRQRTPEGDLAVVIDYKTESRQRTEDRVKLPFEDTQLAFYAALLPDENLRAAYLSLAEGRDGVLWVEQKDALEAREALREGLVADLDRIAAGAALPALGEGSACEYCAARGLCRKDFWTPE